MKKILSILIYSCIFLHTAMMTVYAVDNGPSVFWNAPYEEGVPDVLQPECDEEQELQYHDEAMEYYRENRDKFAYTEEQLKEIQEIARKIDEEKAVKDAKKGKGIFKFSIKDPESIGIDAEMLQLLIFCNGVDKYEFLLKKEEGYSVKAMVLPGKYTIGYLKEVGNEEREYSLKEDSFILNAGETYETTAAPYRDPFEHYGLKKMTKEELDEAWKQAVERPPKPEPKEQIKSVARGAYLFITSQVGIMGLIFIVILLLYIRKKRKQFRRPVEFES